MNLEQAPAPVGGVRGRTPGKAANGKALESAAVIVRILDHLASAPRAQGVTEIARELGESKARIHRNLSSLRQYGLVAQEHATDRYRLGWKLFQLGERAALQFDLRQLADPYLKKLRDTTLQSALVSVSLDGEALVIGTADNDASVSITVKPGIRPEPYCSAQGRIALAYATDEQRRRLLGRSRRKLTPFSIVEAKALERRFARIRRLLWEEAPQEALLGINVLSAPVFRDGEVLVGMVSIIGSVQDVRSPPDPVQLRAVQGCAAALSGLLEGRTYRQRGIQVPEAFAALTR